MKAKVCIVTCAVRIVTGESWYKTITPEENHELCLDTPGGNAFNGNQLWLWECNGMDSQHWVFDNYQIRYGGDENFCIDAGDLSDGKQVFLWECNGMDQQSWSYDSDAKRAYVSNTAACFDLWEDQQWNGQAMHIWQCNGLGNQQWDLWDAPDPGPSPSPGPPGPAPGPGGGKAGISAHLKSGDGDTDAIAGSRMSWNYNWAMTGAYQDGLDYYPQIHDAGSMGSLGNMPSASVWLGFNEPNMNHGAGGADMSVEQVVGFWPQIEQAATDHGVAVLVGPNVANVKPDEWYDNFFNQCPNCRVDAIGFHSYSCDLQNMQSLVGKLQKYGKPLWLTEFACADNPKSIPGNDAGSKDWNMQCEYMKQVIPYLEGEASVAKYAWYSFNSDYTGNSQLVSGGQLTDLGNCYNGLASAFVGKSGSTGNTDIVV